MTMYDNYDNSYDNSYDDSYDDGGTSMFEVNCQDPVIINSFYLLMMIPAVLIVLTLSFTQTRRKLFMDVLNGKPGLVHPMDILTKSDRISYMCALGATANVFFSVFFMSSSVVVVYDGPAVMHTLITLVSALVIGIGYFPIFGCVTTGSLLGLGAGSVYTWILMIIEIIRLADCEMTVAIRIITVFRGLPTVLCLCYLSIRLPYKFYKDFPYRDGIFSNLKDGKQQHHCTLEDFKNSNIGLHIRDLFKKPQKMEEKVGFKSKFIGFLLDHTYRRNPRFRFSARFLSTQFLALLLLYAISFVLFGLVATYFTLDSVPYIKTALLLSFSFSFFLGIYGILRMFTNYRDKMLAVNRGELKHLWKNIPNHKILVLAMKYPGYQAVSVFWGFIIQSLFVLFPCAIIAFIVWASGDFKWFSQSFIEPYWPYLLWLVIIYGGQYLMAKYAFSGHKKHLVLDNRRAMFIVSYFSFFYNMFLGIFSCLLRIIMSVIIGMVLVPRLDSCVLPEGYAHRDRGYQTFVGFIKLENDHTHPVMLGFLRLLQILAMDRRNGGESSQNAAVWSCDNQDNSRRRRKNIFKWQTAFTLINNPDLRLYRKGYIQKLNQARELGVALLKSDTFIRIDDEMLKKALENQAEIKPNATGSMAIAAGVAASAVGKIGGIKDKLKRKLREGAARSEGFDNLESVSVDEVEVRNSRLHIDVNNDDVVHGGLRT